MTTPTSHLSHDTLRAMLVEVAQRRAERDRLKAELEGERAALEALLADRKEQLKALDAGVQQSEAHAKALAVAIYELTQEKSPVQGIAVKVGTLYKYDPATALAWAQQTKLCLVPESLDEKAFLKVAAVTPLPFVTKQDDPKAGIASDLSAYLPAPDPTSAPRARGMAARPAVDVASVPVPF